MQNIYCAVFVTLMKLINRLNKSIILVKAVIPTKHREIDIKNTKKIYKNYPRSIAKQMKDVVYSQRT